MMQVCTIMRSHRRPIRVGVAASVFGRMFASSDNREVPAYSTARYRPEEELAARLEVFRRWHPRPRRRTSPQRRFGMVNPPKQVLWPVAPRQARPIKDHRDGGSERREDRLQGGGADHTDLAPPTTCLLRHVGPWLEMRASRASIDHHQAPASESSAADQI